MSQFRWGNLDFILRGDIGRMNMSGHVVFVLNIGRFCLTIREHLVTHQVYFTRNKFAF